MTTWEDSSSANNDATQSSAGAKPTYRENILNDLSVVRFDGNDVLNTAYTGNDASITIIVVAKSAVSGSNGRIWAFDAASGMCEVGGTWQYYQPLTDTGVDADAAFSIISVVYSSVSSANVYVNGGSAVPFDPEPSYQDGSTVLHLGAALGGSNATGDLAGGLLYNSALSAGDRGDVEDYWQTKFGL